MRSFSISVKGRVNNFSLPVNQPLIPLFEAIVNSFQAIEERRERDKDFNNAKISIKIDRDKQINFDEGALEPIESFTICDNGIGFDDENFESFLTSDSMYKLSKGGKGVGRFSWLKAFEKVNVESTYLDNGQYVKRTFEFSKDTEQINDVLDDIVAQDNLTIVKLQNYYKNYSDNVPKKLETIATRIIQHCLVYFLDKDCPRVTLNDEKKLIDLNKEFNSTINTDSNVETLDVKNYKFNLLHVKISDTTMDKHEIFLCANNRVVKKIPLGTYIIDVDRKLFKEDSFWYVCLITGEYFDKNVDMNRLSFNIPEKQTAEMLLPKPSMEEIIKSACDKIEVYLQPYLNEIREEKDKRIRDYVVNQAPQFRHLFKYKKDEIDKIKPNLSDEKLDDELHKIKRNLDIEIKTGNQNLLKKLQSGAINDYEYKEKFKNQIEKVTDANSAVLAEYVAHRKVIIDLLECGIKKKEDGKFNKESYLHNLIYPMKSTSNETPYENHNLWLIDEKLAYCSYISSDIPFNNDPKEERTDIMVLDSPIAVSEDANDGREFDTIVLIELKRPMRNDYTDSENPIVQLYNYVDKLKSNKVKDKNGRPINVGQRTKFYLFAVCDITDSLRKIIRHTGILKETPDNLGYYGYNENYNAYIEILPFDKIINDSKKRNRILFDKLGL